MSNNIPCYTCLFTEPLKARVCRPAECPELEEWLSNRGFEPGTTIGVKEIDRSISTELTCWKCGSSQVVRTGFDTTMTGKKQKFKCKICHGFWREGSQEKMEKRKVLIEYAKERISQTSLRAIAGEILEKYQLKVSHVAIAKWINKPRSNELGT